MYILLLCGHFNLILFINSNAYFPYATVYSNARSLGVNTSLAEVGTLRLLILCLYLVFYVELNMSLVLVDIFMLFPLTWSVSIIRCLSGGF